MRLVLIPHIIEMSGETNSHHSPNLDQGEIRGEGHQVRYGLKPSMDLFVFKCTNPTIHDLYGG